MDLLGAGDVLAGSDWPIVSDGPIAGRLAAALQEANLSRAEQEAVAGLNARRSFRIGQDQGPEGRTRGPETRP